jgi:hypothetical protein
MGEEYDRAGRRLYLGELWPMHRDIRFGNALEHTAEQFMTGGEDRTKLWR